MDYLLAIANGAKDYLYGTFLAVEHPRADTGLDGLGEIKHGLKQLHSAFLHVDVRSHPHNSAMATGCKRGNTGTPSFSFVDWGRGEMFVFQAKKEY